MNELVTTEQTTPGIITENNFESAFKMAQILSKSDIIPLTYKNKPENCLIALELSTRLRLSPFLVMQNMHVIQGKPSWSSTFIIACINASGKFKGNLKFEIDEEKTKCRAYAIEVDTDKKINGPLVTMEMAQAEGWLSKNGSKWKTMPELMLRYRAAAFFGRLYCPEIINGLMTTDELKDISINATSQVDPFVIDNNGKVQENEINE